MLWDDHLFATMEKEERVCVLGGLKHTTTPTTVVSQWTLNNTVSSRFRNVPTCTVNCGKCTGARQWTLCKRGRSQVCICVFMCTYHIARRCIPHVGSTLTQLGHKQEIKNQERQHFFFETTLTNEKILSSAKWTGGIANRFKPRRVVRLVEFAVSVLMWARFWITYVKCQIKHMVHSSY